MQLKLSKNLSFLDSPLSNKAWTELQNLQSQFVFLKVDKGQHDIGYMCKLNYLRLLREQLQSDSYERITSDD